MTTTNNAAVAATTTTTTNEGGDMNMNMKLWNGEDKELFANLSHPGYSMKSDETTQLGGWLAHRIVDDDATPESCWVKDVSSKLTRFNYKDYKLQHKPRILILYGSLRPTSFSRKLAYEFARLLEDLDCDVRIYNPCNLPPRDLSIEKTCYKVIELRSLSNWSEGHIWVSPEMHGQITGIFKNQIDWLPLNTGSVRPTQGRTCLVAQVNGGSQSFNAVNTLRQLARWMRMPCCTNQSSIAKAWKEFDDNGRMKDSSYRDRVIDCAEEFVKFTIALIPISNDLVNRYSERKEKLINDGKLLTQEQKEKVKEKEADDEKKNNNTTTDDQQQQKTQKSTEDELQKTIEESRKG